MSFESQIESQQTFAHKLALDDFNPLTTPHHCEDLKQLLSNPTSTKNAFGKLMNDSSSMISLGDQTAPINNYSSLKAKIDYQKTKGV